MEALSPSLQENLLVLLCFDSRSIPVIISNVKIEHFENPYYRMIASHAMNFYIEFNEPVGNHIGDMLEDILNEDSKRAEILKTILKSIYELKDSIKVDYVLKTLKRFVLSQDLKINIKKAAEQLQRGEVEEAYNTLESVKYKELNLFDPGVFLGVDPRSYSFNEILDNSFIYTGIEALDNLELIPTKKEMYCLMGRSGSGKSMFLTFLGKMALIQRKKVLHITLELSEDRLKTRYFQCLFGLPTRLEDYQSKIPVFEVDDYGAMSRINFRDLPTPKTLKDEGIIKELQEKMSYFHKPQLLIKEFPSGSLSIEGLRAYIENLIAFYNFNPDIILLDYLDLMDIDVDKMRIDLGATAVALRGMAAEYDCAMVTVAQTNRVGEGVTLLTRKHLGEDFSKVKTVDNLITYNQTPFEEKHGLARLYVDKGRNGRRGDIILISQNYSTAQFCLSSCLMSKKYYGFIDDLKGEDEDE